MTTLPLSPDLFWFLVTLACVAGLMLLVFTLTAPLGKSLPLFERLRATLGLAQLDAGLFAVAALLWLGLVTVLTLGLFLVIWQTVWAALPSGSADHAVWDFRVMLAKLVALTGTLGAVVALPITVNRLRLTREANDTAREALLNDKITIAAAELHAQRQVSRVVTQEGKQVVLTEWQDDVIRRNAAIDRLERLANEDPKEAPAIARMLSVYARELSREFPAKDMPGGATPGELQHWAQTLTPARSDMEKAVQTLGRLRTIAGVELDSIVIDLRDTNLQKFDLQGLCFNKALLTNAEMQGAYLWDAQMQGAVLRGAQMQGADLNDAQMQGADLNGAEMQEAVLWGAEMQGADLSNAQMEGADIRGAQMQGADLRDARFDASTNWTAAVLRGAAVQSVDFTNVPQILDHATAMFGDASVTLPGGITPGHAGWPAHWPTKELDWDDFDSQWRAWQRSIGINRDGTGID